MEKYEISKATVENPWVFSLDKQLSGGLVNLESLIKEGFIRTPIQKRSLFIISPSCKANGTFSNLTCLNQDKCDEMDSEIIMNPAVSIASSSQRIIDHIRKNDLDLGMFGRIIIFDLGMNDENHQVFLNDISFILTQVKNKTIELHLFTDQEELPLDFSASAIKKDFKKPAERRQKRPETVPYKEHASMQNNRKEEKTDLTSMPEKIKGYLEQTLTYSNPEELEQIKNMIKKSVPFGRRTYFAAYLLLKSGFAPRRPREDRPYRDRSEKFEKSERNDRRGPRPEKSERRSEHVERAPRRTPAQIVDGKNFYINIGAQDKMNPRELVSFISQNCDIKEEEVLSVTFKSAYSFFTVSDENAEKIIPGLSDMTVGKKKVKINFANRKNGTTAEAAPAAVAEEEAPVVEQAASENVENE